MLNTSDTEYIILENIYDSATQRGSSEGKFIRQRDLAQIAGASLGMTNSILKRLAQKGWISVKKLNSRNIQYAITVDGIDEIIHRSYRYFKKTIKNVVYFKDTLENLICQAGKKGIGTVFLVGTSDLDFIVEHSCHRWGLILKKTPYNENNENNNTKKSLIIYAENINEKPETGKNAFYLSRLILMQTAAKEL